MPRAFVTVFVLLLASPALAQSVDHERLEAALAADGFEPPERFKALVGQVVIPHDGPPSTRWFDWRETSDDRDDWWPASSIKIYAAIAALEQSRAMGYPPNAILTYHYEEGDAYRGRLSDIVRLAIVPSNNHAFNRLVEFVGFDRLNRTFFTEANGLGTTVFLRAYSADRRDPETGHGINRFSPRITVQHGRQNRELEAREGRGRFQCPEQGNCTTLMEMAESIRRIMLHDRLPEEQRFDLGEPELLLLRETLEAERRPHGAQLVQSLRDGFGDEAEIRVYHKPGYAYRWTSDVMFVHRVDTEQCWVISLAAWSGRRVLDDALTRIGRLLASDSL